MSKQSKSPYRKLLEKTFRRMVALEEAGWQCTDYGHEWVDGKKPKLHWTFGKDGSKILVELTLTEDHAGWIVSDMTDEDDPSYHDDEDEAAVEFSEVSDWVGEHPDFQ